MFIDMDQTISNCRYVTFARSGGETARAAQGLGKILVNGTSPPLAFAASNFAMTQADILPFAILASGLVLFGMGTLMGIAPVIKIIRMYEARHELRYGSAGWIRGLAGWAFIAFWLMAVWYFATILGDWAVSGDLNAAVARSLLRLRVLLEIALAIAASD